MRLIGTLTTQRQAQEFSYYLQSQGIDNTLEANSSNHAAYYQIWIVDEDHLQAAVEHYEQFQKNPHDKRFQIHPAEIRRLETARRQAARPSTPDAPTGPKPETETTRRAQLPPRKRTPFGYFTIVLIAASLGCFFWGGFESVSIPDPQDPEQAILVASPLYAALLFDYPRAFEILEDVREEYGVEDLIDPSKLPREGRQKLRQAFTYPFWQGIYNVLVEQTQEKPDAADFDVPLFVKIRQGQIWRLWTPTILHGGILHLIFNLFWLVILGNQVEYRIGPWRYALLSLVAGIAANVCQYLMSGPIFLGLSGVVLSYFGFIWVRQKRAPWEGYELHRLTIIFIGAWVILMIVLQIVAFIFELSGRTIVNAGIANTAHVVGLASGALLGLWDRLAQHRIS